MSGPTLFGRPALEPLILFEPALDVRQGDIAHGRLGRDLLALIASLFGCWFLLKELGNGGTGEAKVAGRCPLALALDQDPGANFISKCHGIHLPSSARLIFLSSIADSWGQWLTFPGSVWPSIMIAFTPPTRKTRASLQHTFRETMHSCIIGLPKRPSHLTLLAGYASSARCTFRTCCTDSGNPLVVMVQPT